MKVTEQFYSGTSLTNWIRLLGENRGRIGWPYLLRAIFVTLSTLVTLPFRAYERVRFDRQIARTPVEPPPVFILGHWRSGTTYLHVLLSQDRGLTCPSNLQVILPEIFLGSSGLFVGAVRRFLPRKRWMDNFLMEPHLPSEDEFAIANLCPYSLYHSLAFPQRRYDYARYCFMDDLSEREIREWREVVLYYMKKLAFYAQGRRLLLKNPMHTARVRRVLELFPDARFIHIYRNPYEVFISTQRMFERMFPAFYLQEPRGDAQEFILYVYQRMYENYFAERHLIPAGNLVEVRYENFIREPLAEVERIYGELNLPGFAAAREAFAAHAAAQQGFRVNENQLDEPLRQTVAGRWRFAFEALGYPLESTPSLQLSGRP